MTTDIIRKFPALIWSAAVALSLTAIATTSALMIERYRLRSLDIPSTHLSATAIENGAVVIRMPNKTLIAEFARYEDELFAYLMFDYMRSRPALAKRELLLTYALSGNKITYILREAFSGDLASGISDIYELTVQFPFLTPKWNIVDDRVLASHRYQSRTFVDAYTFPAYRSLEHLSQTEVVAYTRRFIRLKSSTDPRIRLQIEPVPLALTKEEAQQFAEDIVLIAKFYQLPLEFFLGIGAMENNYMNVKGDIGNAIWKDRPAKDDVILRRRNGRVVVLNESSGEWQITHETLRFAHSLYLRDKRDYEELPERLRPPKLLEVSGLITWFSLHMRESSFGICWIASTVIGAPPLEHTMAALAILMPVTKPASKWWRVTHGRSWSRLRRFEVSVWLIDGSFDRFPVIAVNIKSSQAYDVVQTSAAVPVIRK